MKKKILTLTVLVLGAISNVQAGGLMTNTNYHIAFDRMMARGATFDIDAAYSNPAGMAWTKEGWQLSLNFQKPWQNRDITYNGTKYEGKASAPIVPALFAAYKHDRWAVSSMIGIVGSGGFVEYDNGVPMFNMLLGSTISSLTQGLSEVTGGATPVVTPTQFDSEMKGKQYIYGGKSTLPIKYSTAYRLLQVSVLTTMTVTIVVMS